jgi:hypothetical protein
LLAYRREHFDSASARKHQIQNYQIEMFRVRQEETILPGVYRSDRVGIAFKAFFDRPGDLSLVFDNEHSWRTLPLRGHTQARAASSFRSFSG